MSQHWNRNPATKDYVMQANGSPEETDSLTIPAFHRLRTKKLQWLYAPNNRYGSDFHTIQKNRTASDASLFENFAIRALEPLVEDGRAEEIEATVVERARHGVCLQTDIQQASGERESFQIDPIGV